ncbi:hypothetical protein ACKWTF_000410 [Chironomus riparius]
MQLKLIMKFMVTIIESKILDNVPYADKSVTVTAIETLTFVRTRVQFSPEIDFFVDTTRIDSRGFKIFFCLADSYIAQIPLSSDTTTLKKRAKFYLKHSSTM